MATTMTTTMVTDYFSSTPTKSSSTISTPGRHLSVKYAHGLAVPSTPSSSSILTPGRALASPARPSHRLLYRGALSLPDSHIVLDGITFMVSAPEGGGVGLMELLENPLALALESMRGRPSVRMLGEARLDAMQDVWLDESGEVSLYVHPEATLTHTYFSNILTHLPLDDDPSAPGTQRTQYGIRIALGDVPLAASASASSSSKYIAPSTGTTEIVIFGRAPIKAATTTTTDGRSAAPSMRLVVARISLSPPILRTPDVHHRAPRPDDPTPRRPPLLYFGAKRPRTDSSGNSSNASDISISERDRDRDIVEPTAKRTKSTVTTMSKGKSVASIGAGAGGKVGEKDRQIAAQRKAREQASAPSIGGLPLHRSSSVSSVSASSAAAGRKPSRKPSVGGDPFKVPAVPLPSGRKGKDRADSAPAPVAVTVSSPAGNHFEEVNKLFVKRTVVLLLAKRGVMKHVHPEFAELYAHVYRGASFAFRSPMCSRLFETADDTVEVERLVSAHLDLYMPPNA